MHCSGHKFRQIPASYEDCAVILFKLIRTVLVRSNIVSADHSASNRKCRAQTGTHQQSCISKGRRRTPTQHLRDRQRGDWSLPRFKMTAHTQRRDGSGAGPVTTIMTQHKTLHFSKFFASPCRISLLNIRIVLSGKRLVTPSECLLRVGTVL